MSEAGGTALLLRRLFEGGYCQDGPSVDGDSLQELVNDAPEAEDQAVILPLSAPLKTRGGLLALFGNLAPEGCVLKLSGDAKGVFEGPAQIFESEEDAFAEYEAWQRRVAEKSKVKAEAKVVAADSGGKRDEREGEKEIKAEEVIATEVVVDDELIEIIDHEDYHDCRQSSFSETVITVTPRLNLASPYNASWGTVWRENAGKVYDPTMPSDRDGAPAETPSSLAVGRARRRQEEIVRERERHRREEKTAMEQRRARAWDLEHPSPSLSE